MKLFAGTANKPLASAVAEKLGISSFPIDIFTFPDGERRLRIEEPVAGKEAIVVQPTSPPVDSNYFELYFTIDALKRKGAALITAVVPYLGYQRQDHLFREGEARSLAVVVALLEKAGADRIITCELHSVKIEELFSVPFAHISALSLFAKKIQTLGTEDATLVSPDMGGIRRIRILSEILDNMPYATIVKNRDLATGHVSSESIEGSVKSTAYIVDDMIGTGGTIAAAVSLLKRKGAVKIYVFSTHPVFSGEATSILSNKDIERVFVTDTILVPNEKKFATLDILSVADLIAEAIKKSQSAS